MSHLTRSRKAPEVIPALPHERAASFELLGRVAAGVAHDFNNLLTVILLNTDLLTKALPAGSVQAVRHADEIRSAARLGEELVRHVLAQVRPSADGGGATFVDAVLEGMRDLLRRLLGPQIIFELCCAGPMWPAAIEAAQLQQIILNLAVNARDAMSAGGRLRIETSTGCDASGREHIRLVVSDTGCGMDARTRSRMFHPFFTTKPHGGTGLGLTTVRDIVAQCGGSLVVESKTGQGTAVTVMVPRARPSQASLAKPRPAATAVAKGTETILLVEADDAMRRALRRVLHACGYRVLTARDGKQAWHRLRSGKVAIDLLVANEFLPGQSGQELVARAHQFRPHLRALYISGRDRPGKQFIFKPFDHAVLAQHVRRALDLAKAAAV